MSSISSLGAQQKSHAQYAENTFLQDDVYSVFQFSFDRCLSLSERQSLSQPSLCPSVSPAHFGSVKPKSGLNILLGVEWKKIHQILTLVESALKQVRKRNMSISIPNF